MKKILMSALVASFASACGGVPTLDVAIDGSSTVLPITEAVAEEFRRPGISIQIGTSGTGGGFKKFIAGETDISNASRYIKPKEVKHCAEAGREFIEIPVAYDGLAVVVNKANDFATSMTTEELRAMWHAGAKTKNWSDIRAGWPERPFHLFAPGQDSGTFDYFTDTINGDSGNCRRDVSFSEDDNVLVNGVVGDRDGLAFFGLAYYVENAGQLNCVAIDGGTGTGVKPSAETVEDGTYAPLSRPLFIYVSTEAAMRPEVDDFVKYYIENAAALAAEVGYVAMPPVMYEGVMKRYMDRVVGSEAGKPGSLQDLYL